MASFHLGNQTMYGRSVGFGQDYANVRVDVGIKPWDSPAKRSRKRIRTNHQAAMQVIRLAAAHVHGSDYSAIIKPIVFLEKARKNLRERYYKNPQEKAELDNLIHHTFLNMNVVWMNNMNQILNAYRVALTFNNSAQVQDSVLRLQSEVNALKKMALPVTRASDVFKAKDAEANQLISALQAHAAAIAKMERDAALKSGIPAPTVATEGVLDRPPPAPGTPTGLNGKKGGFNPALLLIPAALGVGAYMMFR